MFTTVLMRVIITMGLLTGPAATVLKAIAEQPPTTGTSLSIRLETRGNDELQIDYDKPMRIVWTNKGTQAVRIWDLDSRYGYRQLMIEFKNTTTGKVYLARRRLFSNRAWEALGRGEKNPSWRELAPREEFPLDLTLSQFAWGERAWESLPGPNGNERFAVTLRFESPASTEGARDRIWSGKIESRPIVAKFSAERLQTPHQYLWTGFPDKAIEMMAADPKWINAQEDDRCTPLHHAARFGHVEAVKWLVEHGAKVDVAAYNDFRPLYFADEPEIVRVILKGKPDLTASVLFHGHTPLQRAAEKLTEATTEEERRRWREISELYREAGATDDLLTAIHRNDPAGVRKLLEKSPEWASSYQGQSPLRLAARLGRDELCRILLEQNAVKVDVDDFERGTGYPIIKEALAHPKVVRLLIEHGADLKRGITWQGGRTGVWIVGDDATALHYAADDGVPETITLLIDRGVDPFATTRPLFFERNDRKEQTALDVAAIFGKADNAIAILEHPKFAGSEKALRAKVLNRCLVSACRSTWGSTFGSRKNGSRLKLIAALLKYGADPNAIIDGMTAIQAAARSVHPTHKTENEELRAVVAALRKAGAKLDLYSAVAVVQLDEVAALLKQDPRSAEARSPDGYPALHFPVGMSNLKIVESLLAAGCHVDIRNQSKSTGGANTTALHTAAFWDRPEIARRLLAKGADVNARDDQGRTPLHDAVRLGNVGVIRLLVENGAQLDAKDTKGRTPADQREQSAEVEKVLQELTQKAHSR